MNPLKIVIVGGGSNAWTPNIVRDMILTPALANAHYVLYDINLPPAQLNKAFLDQLAARVGAKPRITATNQRKQAFSGADYFVIAISTGGLDAMAHDLSIPEKFGVYHTVGDTSGPGGWSRLIRNFDVFVSLASDFNRYAPRAVVLNYTNPMATLTDLLARLCKAPVVGLCHGLFENLQFLKRFYKCQSEDELAVQYGGINHFFWITQARAHGKDLLADMARRLKNKSFTDLLRESSPDAMGFSSRREVATELFKLTGVMPYLGDRHTSEFFPWYITSQANLKKYQLVRTTITERKAKMKKRGDQLKAMVRTGVPDGYLKRTRETAADIINAHSQGKVFIDVGNLPNIGQISNLPLGPVVETAMRVDANGFTPIAFGDLPEVVTQFIEPYTRSYSMVVDACMDGNLELALQALRLDPVCSHLNGEQVNQLGLKLLAAHKRFITAF